MRAERRSGGARRWAALVAVAAALALIAGVSVFSLRERASTSRKGPALSAISGGKVLDGGYLSESDRAGIRLYFDEGSEFALSPGTRGRLRVAEADGVRLGIEHGSASLRITHHPEHRWSVEAGPFLVAVKGTDFTVSWDPTSERFELSLRRGRVTVSGPIVGESLALQAGQKLSVSLPEAKTIIAEERADSPAPPLSSAASVSVSPHPPEDGDAGVAPGRSAAVTTPSARPAAERTWRDALKNGDWDAILDDAERKGIDATLESAPSEDLFALSDAARYRRRADLARSALLAQRRRFPGSPRSVDALFLLGRVEELRANGRAPALGYYDEYLSRAPAGTYAAEALGRKMILTKEATGSESARAIAAEYLERFPQGSYAGAARALQRTTAAPP
jgi:TolA-binding protein